MINETSGSPIAPSPEVDPVFFLLVLLLAAVASFAMGVVTARPSITQARIQHKALLLLQEQNQDPIINGLIHRQIARLERRLHIADDDQDF